MFEAVIVVANGRVNVTLPLVSCALKECDSFDGNRVLGCTSLDLLRANHLYRKQLRLAPNAFLPVIGGSSPGTRVPLFSQARPKAKLSLVSMLLVKTIAR